MIDNVTIIADCFAPKAALNGNGGPFEHNGVIFSPKYVDGLIKRYDGNLGNLRLSWYPEKLYVSNSLQKFTLGNNFSDFHLSEMARGVQKLNDLTGIDWTHAIIKKMEYGCNINVEPKQVYRSLIGYRSKEYWPMRSKGKQYGACCEFTDYRIKAYDKSFQVDKVDRVKLGYQLLRWEISVYKMRFLERLLNTSPVTLKHLLLPKTWNVLANDAVSRYERSEKRQEYNFCELTTHEKRILAEMLVPQIKEDFKMNHKDTYKKDRRLYTRIVARSTAGLEDSLACLKEKFTHLLDRGL
jgi:hypothetical protein